MAKGIRYSEEFKQEDIRTWDIERITKKTYELYQASLQSETTKKILQQHYPQYAHKCKVITHHDIFFYDENDGVDQNNFNDT